MATTKGNDLPPLSVAVARAIPLVEIIGQLGPVGACQSSQPRRSEKVKRASIAAITESVEPSTLTGYGWAVLVFLTWCDLTSVPASERLPAPGVIIRAYLYDKAPDYVDAYAELVPALQLWHCAHSVAWPFSTDESRALAGCASVLASSLAV